MIGICYVEVPGCNTSIDGYGRGVVTGLLYGPGVDGTTATSAFVRIDNGPMLHVKLGDWVWSCDCGTQFRPEQPHKNQCSTVERRRTTKAAYAAEVISRDQFDSLTGLADARRSMGWRS